MLEYSDSNFTWDNAAYSTGTKAATTRWQPPVENLLDSLMKLIEIYVWRGPRPRFNKDLFPKLHCSDLVKEDAAYIVAGVGIVAGVDAYDFLDEVGVILQWSDEYIPLEEQNCFSLLKGFVK